MNSTQASIDKIANSSGAIEVMNNIKSVHNDVRLCHHKVRALYALREVLTTNITRYLEIGVHNGCSLSYVLSSKYPVQAFGIDLFEAGPYKSDMLTMGSVYTRLSKINESGHPLKLISANSQAPETYLLFEEKSFDLIFVDGDHSYNGVKNDFNCVIKYLSPDGIIGFDDNNDAPQNRGVKRFLAELLAEGEFDSFDFHDPLHPGTYKNGVTFLKRKTS
jgi:predicted O-methyltransferase YrrM